MTATAKSDKYFRPGDEVIRQGSAFRTVYPGGKYIVEKDGCNGVQLVGHTGSFSRDAFKLAKPRPLTDKQLADEFRKNRERAYEIFTEMEERGFKLFTSIPGKARFSYSPKFVPKDIEFRKEIITTDVV